MFKKILVANRGEIAVRAFRAAYETGAKTVAVYPYEDRNSVHRLKADEAYEIKAEGSPVRAYLSVDEIIRVAKESGADAIYPGYGFLSENPDLANDKRAARTYGVDLSYIQNLREQANGICQCCGRPGLHHHKRLVIDHDHSTGRVRGLICSNCNSILGFCDDNITTLENLINYLNR